MFGLHRILICVIFFLTPVFALGTEGLSLFEKFIGVLVSSALLFSVIKGYLTVNKIWSRRKNEELANSISIVAAMLGCSWVSFLIKQPNYYSRLFFSRKKCNSTFFGNSVHPYRHGLFC